MSRRRATFEKACYCTVDNPDDARFCNNCSKAFEDEMTPPTINARSPAGILVDVTTGKTFELIPKRDMLIGRGDRARDLEPDIMLSEQARL